MLQNPFREAQKRLLEPKKKPVDPAVERILRLSKGQTVTQAKKSGDPSDLRAFMSELDKAFGKRQDWAQQRKRVRDGLMAELRGKDGLSRFTGMERPNPGESTDEFWARLYDEYKLPNPDVLMRKARASIASGNLSIYDSLHKSLVEGRALLSAQKAAQEQAQAEAVEEEKLARSIERLPFSLEDFTDAYNVGTLVRLKPDAAEQLKARFPEGLIPLEDAMAWLQRSGIDPARFGMSVSGFEARQEQQARGTQGFDASGVQGPTREKEEYLEPPSTGEAVVQEAGKVVEEFATDFLGNVATVLSNDATPAERLGSLGWVLLDIVPIKAGAIAKGLMRKVVGDTSFLTKELELRGIPDAAKAAKGIKETAEELGYQNLDEAVVKASEPKKGQGSLFDEDTVAASTKSPNTVSVTTKKGTVTGTPEEVAKQFDRPQKVSELLKETSDSLDARLEAIKNRRHSSPKFKSKQAGGFNPTLLEDVVDAMEYAAVLAAKGVTDVAARTAMMVEAFGEEIVPHLDSIFSRVGKKNAEVGPEARSFAREQAQPAIDKFVTAMEEAERVGRPEREAAVAAKRAQASGRLSGVKAKGKAAVEAGKKARAVGGADVPDFALKEPLDEASQDALFNTINDYKWGDRLHDAQNTREALAGILDDGKLPQPHEIELLREVFGDDFVKSITGDTKTFFGAANRFGREVQLANPFSRAFDVIGNAAKFASFVAQNPARSIVNSALFGKTVGRETLITPTKIWNVLKGYKKTLGSDVEEVLQGLNKETGKKFEGTAGVFTKAAGMTDAPFYPLYERLAFDDFAVTKARTMPGGAKNRQAIFDQLAEGKEGPLSKQEVAEAKAIANDWALRQTYNIDNWANRVVKGSRERAATWIEGKWEGRAGREAADFVRLVFDVNTRFSRVIGNVALDAANYFPSLGLGEAALRTGLGKGGGLLAKIPAKDARLIADLASKGLTGSALTALGVSLYPSMKEWIHGEIVTTEGGTKFVKWTLLPEAYGGMDADMLPGPFKAILRGATQRMIDESDLTDKQKERLMASYTAQQAVSQPLLSGSKAVTDVATGEGSIGKYGGSRLASQLIPGVVREIAERNDQKRTGVELRKAQVDDDDSRREAEGKKFWAEFIKRIPGMRETLPANVKQPQQKFSEMTPEERRAHIQKKQEEFKRRAG